MLDNTQARQPMPRTVSITCRQVTSLIVDYLTHDLEPQDRLEFKAHLRKCPDCVAFLATYRKTIRVTRSLRYRDIPVEMRERVRQFLQSRIMQRRRGR